MFKLRCKQNFPEIYGIINCNCCAGTRWAKYNSWTIVVPAPCLLQNLLHCLFGILDFLEKNIYIFRISMIMWLLALCWFSECTRDYIAVDPSYPRSPLKNHRQIPWPRPIQQDLVLRGASLLTDHPGSKRGRGPGTNASVHAAPVTKVRVLIIIKLYCII